MVERSAALGVRHIRAGNPRDIPMTKLDGVPVKTRLPVSAWALAALVTLFSLLSSLVAIGGTGHVYQASMTQLLGASRAF
jgi:hypothetical protein